MPVIDDLVILLAAFSCGFSTASVLYAALAHFGG
jgi:hypothetical protein